MTHKIILGESIHPLIKANATLDFDDFKNTLILGDSQSKIYDLICNFTKQLINQDSGMIVFEKMIILTMNFCKICLKSCTLELKFLILHILRASLD